MYELLEEAQSTNLLITGKLDDKLLDYIHDNVKVEVNLELRSWYERRKINRQLNEAKELDIDKSLFGLLKNVDPTGKFNKETPNYYNRLVFRGKLRMLSELQSARIFLANNFVNQEIELIDHLSSYEKELINSKLRYSGKFKNAGGDALNLQNDHHSYEDLEQFLKIYTYFDVDFTINKIVKIEITDISKGKQEAGITSFADALKGKLGGTVMNSEPKNPKQD